jgi:hypothetical protein
MRRSNRPGRIDEEAVCIDALVHRIRQVDHLQEITVERECIDPPDFWMSIGPLKYAVEVTSIVVDEHYDALCMTLLRAVQAELVAGTAAKGTYALDVFRTTKLPRRGTKEWRKLVSNLVQNIRQMSTASVGAKIPLLEMESGRLSLMKLSESGSNVGKVWMPDARWEGEARGELSRLLQERVNTKRKRAEEKGLDRTGCEIMLVFYDAYGYCDAEDARQELEGVEGYRWFHSVFWAASFTARPNILYPENPGRAGVFLYSKNPAWR